jgi:molybdopterin-guanine dinucleotide biosynthesis protein A
VTPGDVTLGILAGGRATRLGGRDKAWLERDGMPQVVRIAGRFSAQVQRILVSANTGAGRYHAHGLTVVPDQEPGLGPLAGLDALARACDSEWLLTLPVDIVGCNECLLPTMALGATETGAFAADEEGVQPLVALWRVERLREGARRALVGDDHAVRALQARLEMACVRFDGVRFGNLNTPGDLRAAGFDTP